MLIDVKIPEIGENISGGTVAKIIAAKGQSVQKDQPLIEMETEKATIEVPSPVAGLVADILIKVQDEVQVGQVIMRLETQPSAKKAEPPVKTPSREPSTPQTVPAPIKKQPEEIKTAPPEKPQTPTPPQPLPAVAMDVPAAPSVRAFAREIGVNISEVAGSGPEGLISIDDVKAHAKRILTSLAPKPDSTSSRPRPESLPKAHPLPDFSRWGNVERQAMSQIRKTTAERLSFAWSTIPQVTQFAKANITELESLRKKYSTPDHKLTITPFLMKVAASALKHFPQFNASVDMDTREIIVKKYINIGVAVDTPAGLLVPVIRDVDKKSILQIAQELNEAAERARNKKSSLDELQGGTFTITNLGGIGGTAFTPIVNWPEVAILGVSRAAMEPSYGDDLCKPRLILPLSLSYDHRVIDGADGARFITWMVDAIQQPFLLEMDS